MDFFTQLSNQYNINLNAQQKEAVMHKNGPALVLAGPGSGKTTVITARTACLIEKGVRPENILTMTFNRAAKNEMEQRFNRIFGSHVGARVHFSTFHSFCNLIVRDYERRQGRRLKRIEGEKEFQNSKKKIISNIYQQINGTSINDDELENVLNEIGLVKNKMIKEFSDINVSTRNFAEIFKTYEEFKKNNLYMDFDDMLIYAYSILVKCPDIRNYYHSRYTFIQVDEGQDLSKIQFEILKLLVKREHNNIFVVADDDQSIYGFRGAEPQYILDIEKQFGTCRFLLLENNYRSSSNIVEISSKFIKKNQARFDKNHSTLNAQMHNPFIIQVKDDAEQLGFIVKTIKEKLSEYNNMSIAILYRNNLSSISIVDTLDRNGIGFKIQQNKLIFFKHWVVQDVLSFFKFSFDQCDYQSLLRIYYKMNRYISKTMMEYAVTTEYVDSVIDGILKNNDMKSYQKRTLIELKSEFKHLAKKHPLLVLDYIEGSFRYFDSVKEYCENTGQPFDYVYGLFGILRSIAQECPTIPLFLQRMDELESLLEKPRLVQERNHVTLTTMHSSKGLEYDCVMMVDLNNQEIPGKRALDVFVKDNDCSLLEEERRLFYVGMTRAKQSLYMVSLQTVSGKESARSVFIDEVVSCINREALDEIGEGICVYHKKFGQGIIASVLEQEDRIILEMDFKGIRKKLDFLTCMESGLISFKNVSAADKKTHKEEAKC